VAALCQAKHSSRQASKQASKGLTVSSPIGVATAMAKRRRAATGAALQRCKALPSNANSITETALHPRHLACNQKPKRCLAVPTHHTHCPAYTLCYMLLPVVCLSATSMRQHVSVPTAILRSCGKPVSLSATLAVAKHPTSSTDKNATHPRGSPLNCASAAHITSITHSTPTHNVWQYALALLYPAA
jgi:hypothetical protein